MYHTICTILKYDTILAYISYNSWAFSIHSYDMKFLVHDTIRIILYNIDNYNIYSYCTLTYTGVIL